MKPVPSANEKPLLRGLVAGLALILILLSLASFIAVRGTRAIEADTADVGREQLVMARLLNDAQAGQSALAAVLHQLTRQPNPIAEEALLRNLQAADTALTRVARDAAKTPEAARWIELSNAVTAFSGQVRGAIHRTGPVPADVMARLFEQHDRVLGLEQQLLDSSEQRVIAAEQRIEVASRELSVRSLVLLAVCLALALLCAFLMVRFARDSLRKLEWHANELSRISWHMLQGQEDIARRFSHELHDELGQSLAAVRSNLTAGDSDWLRRRTDCVNLVDSAIANVRELSQLLRPVVLDDFGLDAGLRWLGERFAQRTGINVTYHSSFDARLADETETHLFRIAQEAFTNIARHSGATDVQVDLRAAGDVVFLIIEDNGRGLRGHDGESTPSLGMTGMRARARQVGGKFRITKPTGGGVRIEVEVPAQSAQEPVHAA